MCEQMLYASMHLDVLGGGNLCWDWAINVGGGSHVVGGGSCWGGGIAPLRYCFFFSLFPLKHSTTSIPLAILSVAMDKLALSHFPIQQDQDLANDITDSSSLPISRGEIGCKYALRLSVQNVKQLSR